MCVWVAHCNPEFHSTHEVCDLYTPIYQSVLAEKKVTYALSHFTEPDM
jgi:hypothetical protein